jgi:hypothetical protein
MLVRFDPSALQRVSSPESEPPIGGGVQAGAGGGVSTGAGAVGGLRGADVLLAAFFLAGAAFFAADGPDFLAAFFAAFFAVFLPAFLADFFTLFFADRLAAAFAPFFFLATTTFFAFFDFFAFAFFAFLAIHPSPVAVDPDRLIPSA